MSTTISISKKQDIRDKIYTIRGVQVMLDRDLAELYQVETRLLNQAVKRNKDRFPSGFMFQLTQKELEDWMSQIMISNAEKMGIRKKPYAFTEQGVAMLSGVLKSKVAITTSIQIIQSFIQMRKFIADNSILFQRINYLEKQQLITETKLEQIFQAIEDKKIQPQKRKHHLAGSLGAALLDYFIENRLIIKSKNKARVVLLTAQGSKWLYNNFKIKL